MEWLSRLYVFDIWNGIGIGLLLSCWLLYPYIARLVTSQDLTMEMVRYRRMWLEQMLSREDRITDVSLARGLFSSVMFLASTSILLISGLLGVLATSTYIHGLIVDSAWLDATDLLLFEMKVIFLILIQIHSFFKFTWSMRLHSYTMILIGAAPPPAECGSERAVNLIEKASKLSGLASQSYFGGLRGYYFGLATLSWFISPQLLILTTIITMIVLIRREHFSRALIALQAREEDQVPDLQSGGDQF